MKEQKFYLLAESTVLPGFLEEVKCKTGIAEHE
jgi:hypothetical protein